MRIITTNIGKRSETDLFSDASWLYESGADGALGDRYMKGTYPGLAAEVPCLGECGEEEDEQDGEEQVGRAGHHGRPTKGSWGVRQTDKDKQVCQAT